MNEFDTNESVAADILNEDAKEEKTDCVQIVWYLNEAENDVTSDNRVEGDEVSENETGKKQLSEIIGYVNVPEQKSKLSNEKVNDAASNQQDESELEQQYYSSQVKLYDAPPVASGYKRIFFDLTNGIWWWLTGDGWPYVSVDGGTTWMSMELVEGEEKVFWSDVPSDFSTIVFARGVKSGDGKYGTNPLPSNR